MDARELVIAEPSIKVVFEYTLRHPHLFELAEVDYRYARPEHMTLKPGWTRAQLVTAVSRTYMEIYNEEDRTSTTVVEWLTGRYLNHSRSRTDGRYGLWGH